MREGSAVHPVGVETNGSATRMPLDLAEPTERAQKAGGTLSRVPLKDDDGSLPRGSGTPRDYHSVWTSGTIRGR